MPPRRIVAIIGIVAGLTAACVGGDSSPTGSADATDVAVSGPEIRLVRPGRANWATGYFQAAIYSALLEDLGYTVADPAEHEHTPADAYSAMARGEFDFWANGWYTQHYVWHEQELGDGTTVGEHLVVLGNETPGGALEGLVITKSVADEHGITSLAQINGDPELVALFDSDGDGLGEIHGCPEPWTCDDIIDEMIEFNGWSNLEQVKAGYAGLVAASIDRVEAGEPAIQYTWSPSGYLSHLIPGENVSWLSVGDNTNVLDGTTAGGYNFASAPPAPFGAHCTDDPCWIGWEVADIQVTANRAFADANPAAARLFELVELSVDDIAGQNLRYEAGENTEADIRRHAREWISAHRDIVDGWLAEARAAT